MTELMSEGAKLAVMKAHEYMCRMHHGQFRKKTGLPYAVHPVQVMCLLSEWGIVDDLTLKGALLHDVLEERPDVTPVMMANNVGILTTNLVEELSFFPEVAEPEHVQQISKAVQKEAYISSFRSKSIRSLVIKIADRIRNTQDFLQTDCKYAPKYLRKAADLFVIFNDRMNEIEELFGSAVLHSMQYSIHLIHSDCEQISSSST